MISVRVQAEDFSVGNKLGLLGQRHPGAVASFVGLVRGDNGLLSMTLEHYPAMTHAALEKIASEAAARWDLSALTIIHRVGELKPGAQIVLVATASSHRAAALESCAYIIDILKTEAPFWKKERFADDQTGWVDARESDTSAVARWTRT
jgi:molybdopterin synthase catalytic subunit